MSAAPQLFHRLEHGRVLDGRCHDVMNSERGDRAENRCVVRLGAAAGKDDLARGGTNESSHRLARVLDHLPCGLALFMNGRSVPEDVAQHRIERGEHVRVNRRRRVVIQIDAHSRTLMNRIAVAVVAVALAAPILAQTDAPANRAPQPQPAAASKAKDPTADPGVRKLSRRERKDRIKNLPEKYQQFLEDVEPIIMPQETDTFLILETDAQRDAWIIEFWRPAVRPSRGSGT